MAMKWLQERWQIFFPILAELGKEQEEQIKSLCEAELAAWRARPSMKEPNSLRKPLTETRNHIRETLLLTEENWWLNPKSGAREHLSLKYLNLSSQEWIELTLPSQQELEARRMTPLAVSDPDALMAQAGHLLEKGTWPEIVLGVGLATGRSIAEILKTGVFTEKTSSSVLFSGPMTVYEVMCPPFEVPTLVRAERILEAVASLRQLFGMHFAGVERRDVSRQAGPLVRDAAYTHFLTRIPLRPPNQDLYRQLTHGIYPHLAVYAYAPPGLDEIVYMATIQNHRKILEASSEEERLTFATAAGYLDYVLVDAAGMRERRRGVRLSDPGVEVLEVFHLVETEPSMGLHPSETRVEHAVMGKETAPDEGDEEEEEDVDEEEELRQVFSVILDQEGNIDRRQGIRLGEPGVEVLEIFKRREEGQDAGVTLKIREQTCMLLDEVREEEAGISYDAAFIELLDAYDGLYRSGLLTLVKRVAGVAVFDLLPHRQDRVLLKRAMQATETPDLFAFLQKAVLAYAQTCVRELKEKNRDRDEADTVLLSEGDSVGDDLGAQCRADQRSEEQTTQSEATMQNVSPREVFERKVLLNVRKQTWARFAQVKEELGMPSDDECLVLLQKAYYLYFFDDPFDLREQVEEMAGIAFSCLWLTEDKRDLIKDAIKYEGATNVFRFLQQSMLMDVEAIVDERVRMAKHFANRKD